MIKVYDNLFAHDFLVETYKTCVKDIPWQYTNSANRSQYPSESVFSKGSHNFFGKRIYHCHSKYNIENNAPKKLFDVLEFFVFKILQKDNLHLIAIDCNLQTYGQNGQAHQDIYAGLDQKDRTIMFYPHYEWKEEWGGALEILDENGNITESILPLPGRIIYFDSTVHHRGLGPTIPDIGRISIAYRLNELD